MKWALEANSSRRTINWYKEQYTIGNLKYDSPSYRIDENTGKYIVYNKSSGKILKNINYKPVNFNIS